MSPEPTGTGIREPSESLDELAQRPTSALSEDLLFRAYGVDVDEPDEPEVEPIAS